MEKRTFFVEGMTCSVCERTLENALSALDGVQRVKANCVKGELEVEFSAPCTAEKAERAIEAAGYSLASKRHTKSDAVYILFILLALYLVARHMGITEIFQSFPTADETQVGYVMLFVIGLLTSVHCVAMCGGLNLAQSMSGSDGHPLRGSILYNLGRLTSYTLIGGILGFIGEKAAVTLQVRGIIGVAAGIFMLAMGVCMLSGVSMPRFLHVKLPRFISRALSALRARGSFGIGLANGLMPCGPLQSMQLYAIACGGFLAGAAAMFSFCLGTVPLVLACGAAAGMIKKNWRRGMLRVGACLLVLMGFFTLQNNLALSGISLRGSVGESEMLSASVEGDRQYITTTLHPNGYDNIEVTVGVPVVWTVLVDEENLNGCNREILLTAFDQKVPLSAGEVTIEFTPKEVGTYTYSCWMGMLRNTITVVEKSV